MNMNRRMVSALLLLGLCVGTQIGLILSHRVEWNSAPAQGFVEQLPSTVYYYTVLHFQDGGIEVCYVSGFTINYPNMDLDVVNCYPDEIFDSGFEQ